MDLSTTIAADSTQINAVDLTGSPRVVTIEGVSGGPDKKQPVNIHLVEFPGRSYRPCKSMRRILVHAWGPDAKTYIGRRMELYNDESVKWGGKAVGGIRIKSLSDIPERFEKTLQESQKSYVTYVIEKLPDLPASISAEQVADFQQRIADAASLDDLTVISTDLKAVDLGAHRKLLQEAWTARRNQLTLNEGNNK